MVYETEVRLENSRSSFRFELANQLRYEAR